MNTLGLIKTLARKECQVRFGALADFKRSNVQIGFDCDICGRHFEVDNVPPGTEAWCPDRFKKCPFCAELIKQAAVVSSVCKHDLPDAEKTASATRLTAGRSAASPSADYSRRTKHRLLSPFNRGFYLVVLNHETAFSSTVSLLARTHISCRLTWSYSSKAMNSARRCVSSHLPPVPTLSAPTNQTP
jgi:hypothetical protein